MLGKDEEVGVRKGNLRRAGGKIGDVAVGRFRKGQPVDQGRHFENVK